MELRKSNLEHLQGIDGTRVDVRRIDTLTALIQDRFTPNTIPKIIKQFRSKKNIVLHLYLPDQDYNFVAKMFVTDTYEKEVAILQKSIEHGLSVPKILDARDGVILMEYLSGETLVDLINRTFDADLIQDLAEWYFHYHSVHCLTKGDPRLRNFIHNDRGLFGVDFEESSSEHWILDIAGAAASLLDTDPINDERKRQLAWNLLENYLSLKHSERDPAIDKLYIETVSHILKSTAEMRKDNQILELAKDIESRGF
jgi:tRNA A-37 threonylcarbamoyl transferase component Bud32